MNPYCVLYLQEMQYVIPFVAKVMESCAKSRVFKPPNPWTIAIMNVLAELHKEPDMKLHLKFEIEVLCNRLEINLEASLSNGFLYMEAYIYTNMFIDIHRYLCINLNIQMHITGT